MFRVPIVLVLIFLFSCAKKTSEYVDFSKGCFEISAGEDFSKTLITRNEKFQIEHYENRIDTLFIKWKTKFQYTLKIKNPKTDLDRKTIKVSITKVLKSGYDFTATIGESRFEQKGRVVKIDSLPCF